MTEINQNNKYLTITDGLSERVIPFSGRPLLLDLLRECSVELSAPCGGNHSCGGCAVLIEGALSPLSDEEAALLKRRGFAAGERLACMCRLEGDSRATLRRGSLLSAVKAPENAVTLALDLGTTTLCFAYFDKDGKPCGTASEMNIQRSFGSDVLSRIAHCSSLDGLAKLHEAIILQINRFLTALPGLPESISVAGNTAMQAILAGIDPSALGVAPYELGERFGRLYFPEETGLLCPAWLFPCPCGFVGGDIVADLLEKGLDDGELLCDLGTNGEMALRRGDTIFCASAAAGPALEGGGIGCGSGAVDGAACSVKRSGSAYAFETIGGSEAQSLCGSAILDALRLLIESGEVDESGYMEKGFTELNENIKITQSDVRAIQLAKGAIAAGILCLCDAAGLAPKELKRIVFTGGFGQRVDPDSARRIGLVPEGFECELRFSEALALRGASLCLSEARRAEALKLAGRFFLVPLGSNPDFIDRFCDCMSFGE